MFDYDDWESYVALWIDKTLVATYRHRVCFLIPFKLFMNTYTLRYNRPITTDVFTNGFINGVVSRGSVIHVAVNYVRIV